jgi:hypothetical protein
MRTLNVCSDRHGTENWICSLCMRNLAQELHSEEKFGVKSSSPFPCGCAQPAPLPSYHLCWLVSKGYGRVDLVKGLPGPAPCSQSASAFSTTSYSSGYAALTACSKSCRASVLKEYRIVVSCLYRSTAATLGEKTVVFGTLCASARA